MTIVSILLMKQMFFKIKGSHREKVKLTRLVTDWYIFSNMLAPTIDKNDKKPNSGYDHLDQKYHLRIAYWWFKKR